MLYVITRNHIAQNFELENIKFFFYQPIKGLPPAVYVNIPVKR